MMLLTLSLRKVSGTTVAELETHKIKDNLKPKITKQLDTFCLDLGAHSFLCFCCYHILTDPSYDPLQITDPFYNPLQMTDLSYNPFQMTD